VKAKDFVCISLAAGAFAVFSGCGGGSSSSMTGAMTPPPAGTMPPPMATTQDLEFPQVHDMANGASETMDPIGVNGGAVTVTPTDDDTSDPSSVR
jgi:hypothetical protein